MNHHIDGMHFVKLEKRGVGIDNGASLDSVCSGESDLEGRAGDGPAALSYN